jgi:hypothetical protein
MTSRSFDHRLLLLFFPGHETHSIQSGRFGQIQQAEAVNVGTHCTRG